MMNFRKILSVVLACGMVASMAACGGGSTTSSGGGNASVPADAGAAASQIIVARYADSDNLDPVTCVGNTNIWIFNLVLEGLVKSSDDGTTIEPSLAESWEISDDDLTYTFKLKPDVKFSDGTPVTAEDWKWSFERAMTTADSKWIAAAEPIEKVEAPDESTFVITLKAPSAAMLANLSLFSLSVQSKAHFDKVGADEYKNGVIGTGPYAIKEWRKGEAIVMERNPNYHITGLPKTDEIVFKVVADDNARVMQLQAGEIDVATNVPFSAMQQLESDERIQTLPAKSTETRFMALNTKNQYLADKKVRQAINTITDPQTIVDMVLYGYGTAASGFMVDSSGYLDPSLAVNVPDLAKAQQLMSESAFPEGFTIDLMYHAGNAVEEQIATILKDQWSQINVNVELAPYEKTTYTEKLYATEFDSVIDYWTDDIPDPAQFMSFIYDFDLCSGFDTNYQNPKLVELGINASIETDHAKRVEYYNEFQQIIDDEAIFVPLCYVPYANAASTQIEGFVQTPLGNYRFENMVKTAG